MTNTELIKALRCCVTDYNNIQSRLCNKCPYAKYADGKYGCENKLKADAADALEAAEKRIKELEARFPKEGEWIGVNPMVDTEQCSICGWNIPTDEFESNYCPNCGAKMRNVTDCHTLEDGER